MSKPIDKSKPSNRRCINCIHYPKRRPAPEPRFRSWNTVTPEAICGASNDKPINYWNCCKQFQWNPDKSYTSD